MSMTHQNNMDIGRIIKGAREYSYLGLYKEAEQFYRDSLKIVKSKIIEKKKIGSKNLLIQYETLYS